VEVEVIKQIPHNNPHFFQNAVEELISSNKLEVVSMIDIDPDRK
jgi:hypothetical protein